MTGRAVLDYQIDNDHLVYASYSRGYKSGGINPPLSLAGLVPESFEPEFVDAFEVGYKNTFGNAFTLNLTGFYYKYGGLQISRIVQRTSVNDNIDATIYGVAHQLGLWRGARMARLVARLVELYRELLANSAAGETLLAQALTGLARAAAR